MVLLVAGGLITSFIAINAVTPQGGIFHGFEHLYKTAGDKFHMILSRDNPQFSNLPGIAVLIGGLWVANLYYWGFNQYIIQRTLAAKSVSEAQRGMVFAAFLKLIIPLLVVIPGIVVYVLYSQPEGTTIIHGIKEVFTKADGNINYDKAYPWLIGYFLPAGIKGLAVAALTAAIVSSLASMLNSTSTIFTMDIYKPYFAKNVSEKKLVRVGRLTVVVSLIISVLMAPLLGNIPQMFQYIQEYTGLVSPGILSVFLLGLFWKKTTNKAAIVGIIVSIFVALFFKIPSLQLPFLDQMLYTMLITIVIIMGVSLISNELVDDPKGIKLTSKTFFTDKVFNAGSYAVIIILVVLYSVFW